MRRFLAMALLAVLTLTGEGCSKGKRQPERIAPANTLVFQFTRKVRGPVELMIDGVRIPVEPARKNKKARTLVVTGLSVGKHRYFLSSSRDAFGPDQGEFDITAEKGAYLRTFAQSFNAVLYGKADALPSAEGLPGVKARLLP